jgi:hypothetical protein
MKQRDGTAVYSGRAVKGGQALVTAETVPSNRKRGTDDADDDVIHAKRRNGKSPRTAAVCHPTHEAEGWHSGIQR